MVRFLWYVFTRQLISGAFTGFCRLSSPEHIENCSSSKNSTRDFKMSCSSSGVHVSVNIFLRKAYHQNPTLYPGFLFSLTRVGAKFRDVTECFAPSRVE